MMLKCCLVYSSVGDELCTVYINYTIIMIVCVRACVCACVCACVRVCVRVCVHVQCMCEVDHHVILTYRAHPPTLLHLGIFCFC